jgi:hypothetical protein
MVQKPSSFINVYSNGHLCVSEQLAGELFAWAMEPLASIRELKIGGDWPSKSIVILQAHSVSLGTPEVVILAKFIRG